MTNFTLSDDVPIRKLRELFIFKNGRGFKKDEWTTKGLPIIRIQNLNNPEAPFNYYSGEYSDDIVINSGDLLFSWSGTIGSSFGSHVWQREKALLNQHIFKVSHSDGVDRRYAFHALRHITKEIESAVNGSVGLVHITKSRLNEFTIPLPPLPEQRRIVAILDEAFAGIATARANAERNLRNARAIFESHLEGVFSRRGEGWVDVALHECCTFSSGGTPSKSNATYWVGDIPWVSGRDMKTDQIGDAALHISRTAVDESATRIAPTGSLLILVRGMGLANGVAIANVVAPCAFNQDIRAIHPHPDINSRFLLFALRTKISRDDRILNNAAHGTLKINMDDLRSVRLSLPDAPTQKKIAGNIDSVAIKTQNLETLYQRKLAALDELKKSLLDRAFSGRL